MKTWRFVMRVGVFSVLVLSMAGCHSAKPQAEVTKANFGYPGMQKPPGYYAVMQKMRDDQAAQTAQAQAKATQSNQAATPAAKP